MKNNRLIIDDTEYELDGAYLDGALAMRRGVPWICNPHKEKSMRFDQWDYGHVNESARFHTSSSEVDVILAVRNGETFRAKTCELAAA